MSTIIGQALYEWLHRKMAVALLALSILMPVAIIATSPLQRGPEGFYIGAVQRHAPLASAIADVFNTIVRLSTDIWLLLCAFAVVGLLCSYLERGWAELLFTRAQARWKFLVGRWLAGVLTFAATLTILLAVPAGYYARAGWNYVPELWRVVLLLTVSFSALAATAAFASMSRSGSTLPVALVFLQLVICSVLSSHDQLKTVIHSVTLQRAIDGLYWALPKHSDLGAAVANIATRPPQLNTAAVWTTLAFTGVVLAMTAYRLERAPL